jgi:hypothetical protein
MTVYLVIHHDYTAWEVRMVCADRVTAEKALRLGYGESIEEMEVRDAVADEAFYQVIRISQSGAIHFEYGTPDEKLHPTAHAALNLVQSETYGINGHRLRVWIHAETPEAAKDKAAALFAAHAARGEQ